MIAVLILIAPHWSGEPLPLKGDTVLIRWHWKGKHIETGLYKKDDNGNMHGVWGYLDQLTPAQIRAVERGEFWPLEKHHLDYLIRSP